jgi:hypothetical protein
MLLFRRWLLPVLHVKNTPLADASSPASCLLDSPVMWPWLQRACTSSDRRQLPLD